MRTSLFSITCLRNPTKFPGPALPVSMAVVTPERRQKSSASMPSEVPPQYTWVWRSMRPGVTIARELAYVGAGVGLQSLPDAGHFAVRERDIRHRVEVLRRIDHATVAQNKVI